MKTVHILEYLPKRYEATQEQKQDRQICYGFKDGYLSETVKKAFLDKIREITGNNKQAGHLLHTCIYFSKNRKKVLKTC